MRSVEVEGNSRVDATRRALDLLGADIDDVKVEVVKEEPRGFFAFLGFKSVTVRVTLVEENILEHAGEVINKLVSFLPMPVEARVALHKNTVTLTLSSHELRQFQKTEDVADALGHVLELIVNRRAHNKVEVKASFAEDKLSREDELVARARAVANRVAANGREEALPPMSPRDRRTVHMTLERDDRVTTQSAGDGPRRHVVVYPAKAHAPARAPDERRPEGERARPPSRRRRRPSGPKPAAAATPAAPKEKPAAPAGAGRSRRPRRRTRPKGADGAAPSPRPAGGKKTPPPRGGKS